LASDSHFGDHNKRLAQRRYLDPAQDLRRYEADARRTGDVASRQHYAEELIRHGRPQEAIEVYRQALSGTAAVEERAA